MLNSSDYEKTPINHRPSPQKVLYSEGIRKKCPSVREIPNLPLIRRNTSLNKQIDATPTTNTQANNVSNQGLRKVNTTLMPISGNGYKKFLMVICLCRISSHISIL